MFKYLIALSVASLLVACTSKAPDCADSETQKSVITQVNEKIKSSGLTEDSLRNLIQNYVSSNLDVKGKISDLQFSLEKIAPSKYDKDIDKHFCKANLVSSYAEDKSSLAIEYTSQKADGGKQHLVNLQNFTNEDIGKLTAPLLKDISKEKADFAAKLRSQIGDGNIDSFIEKYCQGLDKDEKQCAIGEEIKRTIEKERSSQVESLTKTLLEDRAKFVETYNNCVAFYKKNERRMNDDTPRKVYPKEVMVCDSAYMAAIKLDISPFFHDEIGKK